MMLDALLREQAEFWMGVLTAVSSKSATPITELQKMDIFDFFALLGVVEKQNRPQQNQQIGARYGQHSGANTAHSAY